MRRVFADSLFWVGLIDPNDPHNAAAYAAWQRVAEAQFVTTDSVFTEVLAHLRYTQRLRVAAVRLVQISIRNPNIIVVRQDAMLVI